MGCMTMKNRMEPHTLMGKQWKTTLKYPSPSRLSQESWHSVNKNTYGWRLALDTWGSLNRLRTPKNHRSPWQFACCSLPLNSWPASSSIGQTVCSPPLGKNARKINGKFIQNGHWLKAKTLTNGKVPSNIEDYTLVVTHGLLHFHGNGII